MREKAVIAREGRVTSLGGGGGGVRVKREREGEGGIVTARGKCISVVVNDERGVPAAVIAGKLCYYEQSAKK